MNVAKNHINNNRNGNIGLALLISLVCCIASTKIFQANHRAMKSIAEIINQMPNHINVFHNNCRQLKLLGSSAHVMFFVN